MLSVVWLLQAIMRAFGPLLRSGVKRRIFLVTCLAAPGTLLIAGMGCGVVLAAALFLAGLFVALRHPRISATSALLAGLPIGLALASR